jgi:hypothetical protein
MSGLVETGSLQVKPSNKIAMLLQAEMCFSLDIICSYSAKWRLVAVLIYQPQSMITEPFYLLLEPCDVVIMYNDMLALRLLDPCFILEI